MTTTIERAGTNRRINWLTIVGVILLPAVLGAVLVAALYNPTERLDSMTAAIVNQDEAVTLDGQLVPLGRQLTAGLVEGSDDIDSNITWVVSNEDDAKAGLADGTYQASVTIPESFSSAALSTTGDDPVQATITVTTAPDARIMDDAITTQVTQAAATLMGDELSKTYLENVFLGFTTLGDSLGEAADGATQLSEGAAEASDGAMQLADGGAQLADGAAQLADGAQQLSSGASTLSGGLSTLAGGAADLSAGANDVSTGLTAWSAGAGSAATGARDLADGLQQLADGVTSAPGLSEQQIVGMQQLVDGAPALAGGLTATAQGIEDIAAGCAASGAAAEFCAMLSGAAAQNTAVAEAGAGAVTGGAAAAAGLLEVNAAPSELGAHLTGAAAGAAQLADGVGELASGADAASSGASQLASGASALSSGADEAASGASSLATGAAQVSSGAYDLSTGAGTLAEGTVTLADGVSQLSDGAGTLADGLGMAADELPSYTDAQATTLASVVADPVTANSSSSLFGIGAVPLLAVLVLWFGGLASFVTMQAATRRALTSRQPSVLLTLRSLAPGAAIGAVQGLLVAVVVQIAGQYAFGTFLSVLGISMLAGVVFAAVHQALVAVFGGAGRWIAAIVGAFAVATSVISTVPAVLAGVASLLPTAPGTQALMAVLADAGGLGGALFGLLAWGFGSVVATTLAVTRQRTTSAKTLVAAMA